MDIEKYAKIEAIKIEVKGMGAENKEYEIDGYSYLPNKSADFDRKAAEIRKIVDG